MINTFSFNSFIIELIKMIIDTIIIYCSFSLALEKHKKYHHYQWELVFVWPQPCFFSTKKKKKEIDSTIIIIMMIIMARLLENNEPIHIQYTLIIIITNIAEAVHEHHFFLFFQKLILFSCFCSSSSWYWCLKRLRWWWWWSMFDFCSSKEMCVMSYHSFFCFFDDVCVCVLSVTNRNFLWFFSFSRVFFYFDGKKKIASFVQWDWMLKVSNRFFHLSIYLWKIIFVRF